MKLILSNDFPQTPPKGNSLYYLGQVSDCTMCFYPLMIVARFLELSHFLCLVRINIVIISQVIL